MSPCRVKSNLDFSAARRCLATPTFRYGKSAALNKYALHVNYPEAIHLPTVGKDVLSLIRSTSRASANCEANGAKQVLRKEWMRRRRCIPGDSNPYSYSYSGVGTPHWPVRALMIYKWISILLIAAGSGATCAADEQSNTSSDKATLKKFMESNCLN